MSLRSDPKISHGDSVRTRTEFLAKEHFRKLQEAWITKDGYTRNLYLEEFLPSEIVRVRHLITSNFSTKR